jgi:hypothetical protein
MFCPQCGADNKFEQKYCRRCGLQLAASRISLQGGVGNALTRHRRGEIMFAGGGGTLVIFVLAALANIFLDSGPYPVLINLLLGLVSAVPLMTAGFVHMRGAGHALNPKDEPGQLVADQSDGGRTLASSAYSTDPLLPPKGTPDSITEQTTLNLRAPKHGNG